MNKTATISDKAKSLLNQIKETSGNALNSVKEHPEALTGLAGAGSGLLLSHLMQDPKNRSVARYLLDAGIGGSLGVLAGNVFKPEKLPETLIYKNPEPLGGVLGGSVGLATKGLGKALGTIPTVGKKILQAPGRIVQGAGEAIFGGTEDLSKPIIEGPKPLGVVGNTLSGAAAISLLSMLLTKGKFKSGRNILNTEGILSKLLSRLSPVGSRGLVGREGLIRKTIPNAKSSIPKAIKNLKNNYLTAKEFT